MFFETQSAISREMRARSIGFFESTKAPRGIYAKLLSGKGSFRIKICAAATISE